MRLSPLLMAGGALIVIALVLSMVMVPLEETWQKPAPDFNDDGTSDGTYSVEIVAVDESGNYLSVMPFELIQNGGAPADHLIVIASWTVSGQLVDWTTFSISLTFELREYSLYSIDYEVIHADSATSTLTDSLSFFSIYESDISEIDDGAEHNLNLYVLFDASVSSDKGVLITSEDEVNDGGVMITITQAGMNVQGTVSYDPADMNIVSFSAVDLGLNPLANPAMAVLVVGALLIVVQILKPRKR